MNRLRGLDFSISYSHGLGYWANGLEIDGIEINMESTAKLAAFLATCFCVISIGLCHWTMHYYDSKKHTSSYQSPTPTQSLHKNETGKNIRL